MKRERKVARRRKAKRPFDDAKIRTRGIAIRAMWVANCYPIEWENWLIPQGHNAPREGLVWYARELRRAVDNAEKQRQMDNSEAAMLHAFQAGALYSELEVRLAHGEKFDKYEAVSLSQRDAALARRIVPDEARRETYWRFRKDGHKRSEAGKLAGQELGLSEGSIRNAFPDSKYPAD